MLANFVSALPAHLYACSILITTHPATATRAQVSDVEAYYKSLFKPYGITHLPLYVRALPLCFITLLGHSFFV
jgi:hypothetical protein